LGSQLDLDQGGTFRQYQRVWMGPSVGWLNMPIDAILEITAAGTYPIQRWTTLIKLNVDADITINLPSSKASPQGPQAIPGQWVIGPVTIMDVGGHASSRTYTINPASAELISGLATIQLGTNFGSFVLEPLLATGGWNVTNI